MRGWIALPALCLAGFCLLQPSALGGRVYKSRINPNWAPDDSHMWYRNDLAGGAREYVLVDLKKGTREPAFDQEKLAKALIEKGLKGVQSDRLPIDRLQFGSSAGKAFFRAKGKPFEWNRKTHQLKEAEPPAFEDEPAEEKKTEEKPGHYRPSRKLSPDGKWTVFARDHNLFVKPTGDGDEIQLSKDGKEGHAYKEAYWAPDSNHLVSFRVKPGKVSEVHLVDKSGEVCDAP